MSRDLISRKTRYEFREYLVGWTLREIEGVFDSADVPCRYDHKPQVPGQRRALVEQYYASLDFTSPRDIQRLLKAYEYILNEALSTESKHITGQAIDSNGPGNNLIKWLRTDRYDFVDNRIVPISGVARVTHISLVAQEFDAPHLAEIIRRLEESVDRDPSLAIGSAKELVESTCKTILEERGKSDNLDKLDLAQLVKLTTKELSLIPSSIPDSVKGAETIKRLLSNLATVTQGLAEIRNLYGTGHGKHGKRKGLMPRHARLAVGAAATLATFLFDTHRARDLD